MIVAKKNSGVKLNDVGKSRFSFPNSGDMIITNVHSVHIYIFFPAVGSDPVMYSTDAVTKGANYTPTCEGSQHTAD